MFTLNLRYCYHNIIRHAVDFDLPLRALFVERKQPISADTLSLSYVTRYAAAAFDYTFR